MNQVKYILINETGSKDIGRAVSDCHLPEIGQHIVVEAPNERSDKVESGSSRRNDRNIRNNIFAREGCCAGLLGRGNCRKIRGGRSDERRPSKSPCLGRHVWRDESVRSRVERRPPQSPCVGGGDESIRSRVESEFFCKVMKLRREHPDAVILGISELRRYRVQPSKVMNDFRRALSK